MATERNKRPTGGRTGGGAAGDKVAVTVRIDRDTFELLQNVALGHEVSRVAAASRHGHLHPRDRTQSVAAIIESLVERHRESLAAEDRLKLDRGKGAPPGARKGG